MLELDLLGKLRKVRSRVSLAKSKGLGEELITELIQLFPELADAISVAYAEIPNLEKRWPELKTLSEEALISKVQGDFLNFYPADSITPYIPAAARGPWVVSAYGAVIYDVGGYGMLGFGHCPQFVQDELAKEAVMANIMTPSFSQYEFGRKLRSVIGVKRGDRKCPYLSFVAINSGSEAVTVAARISDVQAKLMTDGGAKHAGKTIKYLSLKGSFHGRTERPAQVSSSSRKKYEVLASFRNFDKLITVEPNDLQGLREAFQRASRENVFIEAMFLEPVMGEGNPGMAMTPEFYSLGRELTSAHDTLLIVDSIQAGLRAHGVLSIVDYPGFENLASPDMETFSKALNAGQFPLSIVALSAKAASLYKTGIYGNTMTANPRALNIATAVLSHFTPDVSSNIVERGREFLQKLEALKNEFPHVVSKAQGTGLLFSLELRDGYPIEGSGGVEEFLRLNGLNVIHGGKNSLRFTPHFRATSREADLIISCLRTALKRFASADNNEAIHAANENAYAERKQIGKV